jgi:hypothetical protein
MVHLRCNSFKQVRVMAMSRPTILHRDIHSITIKVVNQVAIIAVVTIPVPGAVVVLASVAHGTADAEVITCPGVVGAVAVVRVSAAHGTAEVAAACHGIAVAEVITCPGVVDAVVMVRVSVVHGIVDVATACHGRTTETGGVRNRRA